MEDRAERKIFRLLPCNKNDVPAMEAWLEDMAAEGYLLKRFFLNIAIFTEVEPMHVRCRMLPRPKNKLLDMGGGLTEQEQFVALCEQEGWRHVADTIYFSVFYTKDSTLPEPERDLYALASEQYHNAKKSLIMDFVTIICMVALIWQKGTILLSDIVQFGTLLFAFLFWILLFIIAVSMRDVIGWRKLKDFYQAEITFCDWREGAEFHKFATLMVYIVTIFLCVGMSVNYLYNVHPNRTISIQLYEEPLPAPRMSEWYSDTVFLSNPKDAQIANYNVIEKQTDLLAPVMLSFNETGALYRGDTLLFAGRVKVEYYETISPILAQPLAKSLYEEDKLLWEKFGRKNQLLETIELLVDEMILYDFGIPTFVMAEGNKVVRVQLIEHEGTGEVNIETLARIYGAYLFDERNRVIV